jgi:hypothetical protein
MPIWSRRRTARPMRSICAGLPCRGGAPRAGPRDGDPAHGLDRGGLAADRGRRRPAGARDDGARRCRGAEPRRAAPPLRQPVLPKEFQWLRSPWPDELCLTDRPGWLGLHGRETVGSLFRQSLAARRQQAFRFRTETVMAIDPADSHQAAELICYYSRAKFHLSVIHDETLSRCVQVMSALPDQPVADGFTTLPLADGDRVRLRVDVDTRCSASAMRFRTANGSAPGPPSTPASCRTKPAPPARPTSPAPSSAWPAGTSEQSRPGRLPVVRLSGGPSRGGRPLSQEPIDLAGE